MLTNRILLQGNNNTIREKLIVSHTYHETKLTTWIQINQLQPTDDPF